MNLRNCMNAYQVNMTCKLVIYVILSPNAEANGHMLIMV